MTRSENAPSVLRAGIGKSDITAAPSSRPIRDRLFARALVFEDKNLRLAIVTLDAVAIGGICDVRDEFLPELRARIGRELGIPGHHVLVNASHTHPPDTILCPHGELLDRTFRAVREAAGNLCEVRVGAGRGHNDRISMNRNLRLKNGKLRTIRHANPCPPDEDIAGVGAIDPGIGVLRVDRLDGTPLAVVYNFACHLLFGDTAGSITANFVGIASGMVESTLGHNATAFFLQGAAGDIIDIHFKNLWQPRDIQPLGENLGQSVLQVVREIRTSAGGLAVIDEYVDFPRRRDIPGRIAKLKEEQQGLLDSLRFTTLNFKSFLHLHLQQTLSPGYPAHDAWGYMQEKTHSSNPALQDMKFFTEELAEKYRCNIRAMERLAHIQDDIATFERHAEINRLSGSDVISAELQGMRIGDFVLLAAPLEVLSEVGMNVKKASPHSHTYIAAFSNGYMHYGPPADSYDTGSYETTECFLAPEWQGIFEQKAREILGRI